MIRQVSYFKRRPRFIKLGEELYEEVGHFVECIKRIMESEGNIYLVLEPGDATHYEFLLIQCGVNLAIAMPQVGWSIIVTCNPMTVTPDYIEDHLSMKINPYTLGVICQLLHDVYEGSGKFYDWDKAIPIEIVKPEGEACDGEGQG